SRFPAYLQQADMESNGKSVNKQGEKIDYQTGPIVWGEPGTNGQHAFYQLIHQGTKLVPVDLIVSAKAHSKYNEHHTKLMANCIAQGEALMKGKTEVEVKAELVNKGLNETEIKAVLPYKTFSGNKPSSTFVFDKLDPKNLGSLVAMYEHKIFVQGWVWDVYSYDQWGVELGKQLASEVLKELKGGAEMSHDQSTSYLIKRLKKGHLKT
ncbi:MAG: glucose-6-phosphate isomerase, partial [Flavobacteriales bacterium]